MTGNSDEALICAVLNGDLGAFDVFYERYERPLFGFIHRRLADKTEAEDVLQEVFLAIVRDRDSIRRAPSVRAWLYRVACNLCLNRHRSRHRGARAMAREKTASPEPAPHPERVLEQRETDLSLAAATRRMPAHLIDLYDLRRTGMSYEEISDALAIPLGTVKSRMHEMVAFLRKEMQS